MGDMQRTPVSVGSGDPVVGGQDQFLRRILHPSSATMQPCRGGARRDRALT